jgi:DNA-binding NarL/FixJ family response regulator
MTSCVRLSSGGTTALSENGAEASGGSHDYQIVIIDDHELFSSSLMIALRDRGIEARKVPVARLEQFTARPRGERPGVVVLDLNLGETPDGVPIKGYNWVAPLRESGWQVLAVTGSDKLGDTASAIAEGAVGVVMKTSPLDVLLKAVLMTAQGEPLLSEEERRDWVTKHEIRRARLEPIGKRLAELTGRERQVLEEIARGQHALEIARESVVALTTVRTQIRSILRKLDVNSQIEAVALLRKYTEDS